ncbi:hypothetical protein PFISCL1PPCAC_15977 [Pristionchus fissidentatus]|uniref:Signal peptide peptidase n=1 Tax=Pristionchus fissidentatus TaxID=1538716 RepID=A0AAV5VYP2_9BILA|nr:hypothetical protein PFISCL1PPCAC_15977 [Pristionchus fissidentatus]
MNPLLGRAAASMCILTVSAVVIQIACLRSSTIYFFELDSTTVLFVSRRHAVAFPLGLSLLLAAVYFATKRMKLADLKRKEEEEARKRAEESKSPSVSRKVSRTADLRPIFELPTGEEEVRSAERLRRMLSDIEEQHNESAVTPSHTPTAGSINKSFSLDELEEEEEEEKEDGKEEKRSKEGIIDPEESSSPRSSDEQRSKTASPDLPRSSSARRSNTASPDLPRSSSQRQSNTASPLRRLSESEENSAAFLQLLQQQSEQHQLQELSQPGSRKSSIGSRTGLLGLSRRDSINGTENTICPADLYKELGQIDMLTYLVNAVSFLPRERTGGAALKKSVRLSDILADLIAVHVPVWACVAALHVVMLEVIANKCAFYFYYHEETMQYAALISAIGFGLLHEFAGGWLSTDVLALASVYVVVSRVQLVSFQTGVILSVGLIIFDLFWIYVVDLLSTVTKESRAPLMILVPRDNEGGKQSIATLDLMAPGVFLNLLLKFNAMYDPKAYTACWYAAIGGLAATLAITVWRRKITPALVLPLLAIMATAVGVVDRPYDLWRFMIKH